jgi:hypothetical protein
MPEKGLPNTLKTARLEHVEKRTVRRERLSRQAARGQSARVGREAATAVGGRQAWTSTSRRDHLRAYHPCTPGELSNLISSGCGCGCGCGCGTLKQHPTVGVRTDLIKEFFIISDLININLSAILRSLKYV